MPQQRESAPTVIPRYRYGEKQEARITRIAVVNDDMVFLDMMAAVLRERGWAVSVYRGMLPKPFNVEALYAQVDEALVAGTNRG